MADVALTAAGLLLGMGAVSALGVWLVLRACERQSERGFGEGDP
jgi:hypothetical protein